MNCRVQGRVPVRARFSGTAARGHTSRMFEDGRVRGKVRAEVSACSSFTSKP